MFLHSCCLAVMKSDETGVPTWPRAFNQMYINVSLLAVKEIVNMWSAYAFLLNTRGLCEMPSKCLHFHFLVSITFFALKQFLLFIFSKVKAKALRLPKGLCPWSHPWHLS